MPAYSTRADRADLVRRHLEALALMGEVRVEAGGTYVVVGVAV